MHSAYIILISLWVFCYLFADISVQIVAKSQGFVVLIMPISPLLWSSRPFHKFSPPARKLKLADCSASFSLYFPHFMTTASINISMDQDFFWFMLLSFHRHCERCNITFTPWKKKQIHNLSINKAVASKSSYTEVCWPL